MTTYEDVIKVKKEMEEVKDSYKHTYMGYLSGILEAVGMHEKPVYCKQLEMCGMIKIVPNDFNSQSRPYKFAFYPFKKDGTLSRNPRYVRDCFIEFCFNHLSKKSEYEVLKTFKENFSVLEEEN